jgi:hypothetical protein
MKRKYDDPEERRKRQERSRYVGMVRAVFKVCRRQAVPLYSSKYSRRDFTLWQHIALLVLMQRMRKSYREYRNDFLTVTDRLVGVLGLSKLPHFTTIEKFALRDWEESLWGWAYRNGIALGHSCIYITLASFLRI